MAYRHHVVLKLFDYGTDSNDRPYGQPTENTVRPTLRAVRHECEYSHQLDDGSLKQNLGIFFDGQMFDAFVLVEELIRQAKHRIVLIDDYITASLLQRFHKRNTSVTLDCYVKSRFATADLLDAIANYNVQYPSEPTSLHTFERSHDRWLIIDDTVYHFGASLKDLGKRWFSVDIITEHTADDLISRLS